MFDLSNLNDYEFEQLCTDIMMEKLGISLHRYPRGRDGGIDICDAAKTPAVVIQAKHYIRSSYSSLLSALKKELPKVQTINPKQYYVCSGLPLTKKNKDEIYALFADYMEDRSNIVDAIEIDDFLVDDAHADIVRKHYKLWLCTTSVLSLVNNRNVFIDCDELMYNAQNEVKLFVQTQAYFDARRKIDDKGTIIIVGAPGVGKSTISKMLLLHYANSGYVVRYTTDNSLSDIKRTLSTDPEKKEIVLLDDFLGQHYLRIKESQPNEIKSLISFASRNPNKKLILNTRITILNEAEEAYIQFKQLMDANRGNEYLIDLDKMTRLEKARILYNHIYFNALPIDYFMQIRMNQRYFNIICHRNYNPRIVEFVTTPSYYSMIGPEDYYEFVLDKLNNPEDVWRDEFRNRIEQADRILMNTLYSLTNTRVSSFVLERAFSKRIRKIKDIDTSLNPYQSVLKRLSESLIKLSTKDGELQIGVVNPSVNDYLHAEIQQNTNEQVQIVDGAAYIEQAIKTATSDDAREELFALLYDGNLLKMDSLDYSPSFYFVMLVIENGLLKEEMTRNVQFAVSNMYQGGNTTDKYSDTICRVLDIDFIEFYKLEGIWLDPNILYSILQPLEYSAMSEFSAKYIEVLEKYESADTPFSNYDVLLQIVYEAITSKLSDSAEEKLNEDVLEMASSCISNYIDEKGYVDNAGLTSHIEGLLSDKLQDYVSSELEDYDPRLGLDAGSFDYDEVLERIGVQEAIDSAENDLRTDPDNDDYYQEVKTEREEIVAMFER